MKMIKSLVCICLLVLLIGQAPVAQAQVRLGVEFSALWDSDWSVGFNTLYSKTAAKRMAPSIPLSGGIKAEYIFGKWAPYARAQLLHRKLEMFREPGLSVTLVHNTFEFSMGISFYQPINPHMKFFVALGWGMDVVAEGMSTLSGKYWTSAEYIYPNGVVIPAQEAEFTIVNREDFVWSATSRIGIENELGKWGGLQFWTELHLQFAHSYSYQLKNQFGTHATGGYRAHYGAAGISWILSFTKDKE